jgi:hypothetical protein
MCRAAKVTEVGQRRNVGSDAGELLGLHVGQAVSDESILRVGHAALAFLPNALTFSGRRPI